MNRDRLGDNAIKINTRDRLLRAWENSMEMVLDFQDYYQEIKDNEKCPKSLRSSRRTRPCTPPVSGSCSTSTRTITSSSKTLETAPASPRTHCAGLRGIFLHFRSCHWAWFRLQ